MTKSWKPKGSNTCHITHEIFITSINLYFDSRCSRHMTGIRNYLVDIKSYQTNFDTFGDGATRGIK